MESESPCLCFSATLHAQLHASRPAAAPPSQVQQLTSIEMAAGKHVCMPTVGLSYSSCLPARTSLDYQAVLTCRPACIWPVPSNQLASQPGPWRCTRQCCSCSPTTRQHTTSWAQSCGTWANWRQQQNLTGQQAMTPLSFQRLAPRGWAKAFFTRLGCQ